MILSTAAKSSAEIKQMTPDGADAYRLAEAASVQHPYLGLAAALVLLAVAIALFKLPNIEDVTPAAPAEAGGGHKSAWGYRHLVLGAVGIFVYVGGEVSIGSFLVNYFKEPLDRRPDRGRRRAAGLAVLVRRDDRPVHRHVHAADVEARQGAGRARAGCAARWS